MSDIIYGRRKTDNKIISIDEVPVNMKGLLCDCVCAHCGKDLQACSLEGKVNRYFRHHNENKKDMECDYISDCNPTIANETALHKMAKQIIADEKRVFIPQKYISLLEAEVNDLPEEITDRMPSFEFQKAMVLCAESVELEKRLETFTPDILLKTKKGELFVEIFVSHQVDYDKEIKAKEYGSPMLEIDLSEFVQTPISSDNLRKILIDSAENRKWIFYPLTPNAISKAKRFYEENEIVKEYLQSIRDTINKSQRNEYNKKRCNAKIKNLFRAETYESKLRELRNDLAFLKFYETSSNSHWYKFNEYYKKNKCVPFFIDIPISGEMIFQCDRRIWQSVIFNRYIYCRKNVGNSFNIEKIYDNLIKDHGIAVDYDLSYKLINPLDENRSIWLRKEVIDKYINYLEILGFITLRDGDNKWALVNAIKTITPPLKRAAEYLKLAIRRVNQYSPDINRLMADRMREYQITINQEAIEKANQLIAAREKEQREEQERKLKEQEKAREAARIYQQQVAERNYLKGYNEVKDKFVQQHTQIKDSLGNRWVRCEICGRIKQANECYDVGGTDRVNLGKCLECDKRK